MSGRGRARLGVANPLLNSTAPHTHWSTSNVGEAVPGVLTPLGWTLFGGATDHCVREAFYAVGALTRAERRVPDSFDERLFRVFYGRPAVEVDFLCAMGDRMPGTSAAKVAEGIVGYVPEGIVPRPTRRRYPFVALKFPYTALRMPRRARAVAAATATWWSAEVEASANRDRRAALASYRAAAERFDSIIVDQTVVLFSVVQPLYDALGRLVERAGVGDVGTLTGGYGGVPENAVVAALWQAAHGRLSLAQVIERYGYHGPREGEISGRVWREDDAPLRRLMDDYAAMGPEADPVVRERARRDERIAMEREVVAALPRPLRSVATALFTAAARRIPLRGLLKVAYVQALDVCRANIRRFAELAAADGLLDDPEDIWYLTHDELADPLPATARELVVLRWKLREEYEGLRLPTCWQGMPEPASAPIQMTRVDVVTGAGVSSGVVEGFVRVVTDPDFAEVEPGEILVARTTDPSWSSIMFISAALVVDIGGALSHAAVVARELGIPCVVNTGTGTDLLRTGDHVRVNGRAGTIEVLTPTNQPA